MKGCAASQRHWFDVCVSFHVVLPAWKLSAVRKRLVFLNLLRSTVGGARFDVKDAGSLFD